MGLVGGLWFIIDLSVCFEFDCWLVTGFVVLCVWLVFWLSCLFWCGYCFDWLFS